MYEDLARFRSGDVPEVVLASFACPYCLGTLSTLALSLDSGDATGEARCWCRACDVDWAVALNSAQALRMVLAPPPDLIGRAIGVGTRS